MQILPLSAVPSQTFSVLLHYQTCLINLYQKSTGLYFDLFINNSPVIQSMLCLNEVGLVRESYLGFVGQLVFVDMQGSSDPTYDGLGSRYLLTYWTQI